MIGSFEHYDVERWTFLGANIYRTSALQWHILIFEKLTLNFDKWLNFCCVITKQKDFEQIFRCIKIIENVLNKKLYKNNKFKYKYLNNKNRNIYNFNCIVINKIFLLFF